MVVSIAANPTARGHSKIRKGCQLAGPHQSWDYLEDNLTHNAQSTVRIPYRSYALAYIDPSGNVQYQFSPSMENLGRELFPADFEERFLEHASSNNSAFTVDSNLMYNSGSRPPPNKQIHRGNPLKRPRLHNQPTTQVSDEDSDEEFEDQPVNKIGLPIGDKEKMEAYYTEAFRAFHQINCRQVAKAYIKFIEPRKQAKHPYNGGRAGPGETKDPEKTKPDWWPADVIHKEPDHLKRIPRVKLLIHIFRNLGHMGVTARKLKQAGEEAQRQCRPSEKAAILDEIYRVREEEERFERGEIDSSTTIYVVKREKTNRGIREDSESGSDSGQQPDCPASSNYSQQTSTEDTGMQMPSQTLPEHNKIFPSIPGQFESHTPNHLSPTGIKPDYDQFTPMETTPNSNDGKLSTSHINYLHGLPQSPAESQYMNPKSSGPDNQAAGYFNHWPTSFQQPMFSPVDFGNNGLGFASQNYMAHTIPTMMSSSHGSFSLPDLHGARTQSQADGMSLYPPPFRTGSLSHPHMMVTQRQSVDASGAEY
ncbi:hypothetical protein AJ79_00603 [Helicocarpus griseus UAMH5409]|uniref:Subtelomeric hrmA-associated cluster protein AFUB-079030/YDR124W-like helical bundle domain-containing protein n=1 Tax=Helicocarpus griseus UAMH5409 TaxID=1447875 RepID=A0A2B7Y2F7_9EURO|nr:hypothetical protein AJ79_00603 [Helicocarpus griseus UAMH5409]